MRLVVVLSEHVVEDLAALESWLPQGIVKRRPRMPSMSIPAHGLAGRRSMVEADGAEAFRPDGCRGMLPEPA